MPAPTSPTPPPSIKSLFGVMFVIGIQSFGGGASTFMLIRNACLERGWMNDEEIVRTWAISQISPGINLIKLTVLIGYRLRRWPGVIAAMSGLLLPSGLTTALMTAGYALVRDQPAIKAAMRGIIPATIGLSLATAVRMGQPLLVRGFQEGRLRLVGHLVIIAGACVLLISEVLSPVFVLLLAGAAAWLLMASVPSRGRETEPVPPR